MSKPEIRTLATVTTDESIAYLAAAKGDELDAALLLAIDRNLLASSPTAPDDAEVHHALYLMRKARGLDAPSFDLMRVQLIGRARVAA